MPSLPSSQPPPSPTPEPTTSTGARQRTVNSQRTLTDFFSTTMAVTPTSNATNDPNDPNTPMETEENRKRSRESTPEELRAPGDGSLLTNTSIRPRISSDVPNDVDSTPGATSTPNRIALQMQNIRRNARDAVLPNIDSEDDNMSYNDSSTHSNMRRVRDVINGVVSLANMVGNVSPEHQGYHWDNQDINHQQNLQDLQMVSPRARPTFAEPPPPPARPTNHPDTNHDNGSDVPPTNIASILKKTLEESLESSIKAAISEFEEKHLGTLNNLQEKIDQQVAVSDALALKMQALGVETTRNINSIHEARVEIEAISRSKNELASEVANINGNVNRIDTGVQETRSSILTQNEILKTLQDRVSALESQLVNATSLPPANHVPPTQDALSAEEITRVRNRMRQEDDRYFMSTISVKNFWLPNRFNKSRQRFSASIILKALGAEEILGQVNNVQFSNDNKTLRLTFNSQRECLEGMAIMSSCAAQLRRHNSTMPFTFNQMTPPRFNTQRENLYRMASGMKRNGEIDRFIFLVVNGQLVIKASKRGARDWLNYDNANRRQGDQRNRPNNDTGRQDEEIQNMEVDPEADQRCSICLLSLEQGPLSYLHCRHVFHTGCIKVNLEKNVECPQCKQTKPEVENLIKCNRCVEYMETGEVLDHPQIILSRKCCHTHIAECMVEHFNPHLSDFPYTPNNLQALIDSDIHGCHSCSVGQRVPNNEKDFLTQVSHFPGMRSYLSIADMLRIESMRSRAVPRTNEENLTNNN